MSRSSSAAWPIAIADVDITALRRAAVWALLLAKLTAGWGLGWDSSPGASRRR